MNKPEISVVIPVYNEIDNLQPLISEIRQALEEQYDFEIIYVDDGSTDGTRERLLELSKTYSNLVVVKHDGNFGQSAGLLSGVKLAKYNWIATLDGDGQNDPADIPKLYQAIKNHSNDGDIMAAGQRTKRNDSWLRRTSSIIANKVRGFLLKDKCPDTGCGLKVFPRDAFLKLPHFDHLHRFLPALFNRAGLQVIHVPVNHRHRVHGQSKYGVMNRLWVGIFDLIGMVWLTRRPLKPQVDDS